MPNSVRFPVRFSGLDSRCAKLVAILSLLGFEGRRAEIGFAGRGLREALRAGG